MRAEQEMEALENVIPSLEQEEMVCLQKLQNSRMVTQSVLNELETSLGHSNPVTALLKSKAYKMGSITEEEILEEQASLEASGYGGAGTASAASGAGSMNNNNS